jgi:Polysaccharide lyase family 4, domain III
MRVKAVPLALALMTSLAPLAEPADKTVWRVGVFDRSSGEFADGDPHGAVNFVAGQDQPRTAWYAFAPAAWAGKPVYLTFAPSSINFSIAGRPAAAYRLRASLLIGHSTTTWATWWLLSIRHMRMLKSKLSFQDRGCRNMVHPLTNELTSSCGMVNVLVRAR